MERRKWLVGVGSVVTGTLSGCTGSLEEDEEDTDSEESESDEPSDSAESTEAASSDDSGDANETDAEEPASDRQSDGDAAITVRLEQTVGFGEPDEYTITLELSHLELARADTDGEVRYDVDDTLELHNEPDSFPRLEQTLVEEESLPVATYETIRLYGSISSVTIDGGGEVTLSGGDYIELVTGSVFESGDHKEHIAELAVTGGNDGYEVATVGRKTLTW